MQFAKLPPHHLVENLSRRLDHDRRAALARIAEGIEAIAPAKRDEQPDRPLIRHDELEFDRRIASPGLVELRLQSFGCRACGFALAFGGRAEEQRLDFPQPLAKLVLNSHAALPGPERTPEPPRGQSQKARRPHLFAEAPRRYRQCSASAICTMAAISSSTMSTTIAASSRVARSASMMSVSACAVSPMTSSLRFKTSPRSLSSYSSARRA